MKALRRFGRTAGAEKKATNHSLRLKFVARWFETGYHAARVSKRSAGCILLNSLQFEQATFRNGLIHQKPFAGTA